MLQNKSTQPSRTRHAKQYPRGGKPLAGGARVLAFLLLTAFIMPICGCVPSQEIKETYIVQGMAFDSGDQGFMLTFQLFNPKSSGGGGSSGSSEPESLVVQSTGKTIYDAIRNATLKVGRKLDFSNTGVFIASDQLCRTRFKQIVDFTERAVEIRPSESLYVAHETDAASILTAKNNGQTLSADKIKEVIQNYITSSKILNNTMEDLYATESGGTQDVSLPCVEAVTQNSGDTYITLNHTAVFSRNKLAGYLTPSQTRGVLWILGKVKSGVLTVTPPIGGRVSLEISRGSADNKITFKNGSPRVTVGIHVISSVADVETQPNLSLSKAQMKELTTLQNNAVRQEVESALKECLQKYDADIFGFGTSVFEKYPNRWKSLGESDGWTGLLRNLPVTVKVTSIIQYSGLIKGKVTEG